MSESLTWIDACSFDDIDEEDLITFAHDGHLYAIYRSPSDEVFVTDGHCTHEKVSLADGLVLDYVIECPMHNARFDYRTGEALSAPACVNLKTYPVKREGDRILIGIG